MPCCSLDQCLEDAQLSSTKALHRGAGGSGEVALEDMTTKNKNRQTATTLDTSVQTNSANSLGDEVRHAMRMPIVCITCVLYCQSMIGT
jgi:hypothetical protein